MPCHQGSRTLENAEEDSQPNSEEGGTTRAHAAERALLRIKQVSLIDTE